MSRPTQIAFAVVGGALALAIVALGIGAGLNVLINVGLQAGTIATVMAWSALVAGVCVSLLVAATALARLLDAGERRLSDPSKSYTGFLGFFVGGCAGVVSKVLTDDPILNIAIGTLLGLLAAGGAAIIKARPGWGLALYVSVPVVAATVVALNTSPDEFNDWIDERTARDWGLLVMVALTVVGVPLVVRLVEHKRARVLTGRSNAS